MWIRFDTGGMCCVLSSFMLALRRAVAGPDHGADGGAARRLFRRDRARLLQLLLQGERPALPQPHTRAPGPALLQACDRCLWQL